MEEKQLKTVSALLHFGANIRAMTHKNVPVVFAATKATPSRNKQQKLETSGMKDTFDASFECLGSKSASLLVRGRLLWDARRGVRCIPPYVCSIVSSFHELVVYLTSTKPGRVKATRPTVIKNIPL